MSADQDLTYFDSLCEEEQSLQENYSRLNKVLQTLKSLTTPGKSDADQLSLLHSLQESQKELIDSSIDLRYVKYNARESQVTVSKRSRRNASHSKLQSLEGLREYITLWELSNKETLDYINLLQRLSVDLAKQIEISDPEKSAFEVNRWEPTDRMQTIVEQLADPNVDSALLNSQLVEYMDQIKMERAKYTIENKHSLQETLIELNKEVNYWRRNWNAIENLMFGDNSHSIKRMIHSIDILRSKLADKNQIEGDGMDVNMS